MLFTTGLLVGRAYALAHTQRASRDDAIAELLELAVRDVEVLAAAEARVRHFADGASEHDDAFRAQALLDAAMWQLQPGGDAPDAATELAIVGVSASA
jgi:hypothetical protein